MTKTNFFVDKSNELDNEFRGRVEIEKDDDHQNDWIELNSKFFNSFFLFFFFNFKF